MRLQRLIVSCMLAMLCGFPLAIQAAEPVSKLQETLTALRAVKASDDMPPTISSGTAQLLEQLRPLLRKAVINGMEGLSTELDAQALTTQLAASLQKEAGTLKVDDENVLLGNLENIQVIRPENIKDIALVSVDHGVYCGNTTTLFVFGVKRGHWSPGFIRGADEAVLKEEDGVMQPQASGLEGMQYRIVSHKSGALFLALTWSPPWCTSCWSALHIELYRLDEQGDLKKTLLNQTESFYRCDEDENTKRLKLTSSSLTVSFMGPSTPDEVMKPRTMRFTFDMDKAKRDAGHRGGREKTRK